MSQILLLFCVGMALSKGLEASVNSSSLAHLAADQATWRRWSCALFVHPNSGQDHELAVYIKVMSSHFIRAQKQKGAERRSAHKTGTIFINNFSPHYKATTPTLIYANKNNIRKIRFDINNFNNNSINIDSDIVLAYPSPCADSIKCERILLEQIYKISGNATSRPIGQWTREEHSFRPLITAEARFGNKMAKVRVGIKNSTAAADELDNPNLQSVAEKEEEVHLINLLKCVFAAMNISYELFEFPKLGWKNDEGTWTHLLGAISEGSVHVGADTVDLRTDGVRNYMALTNPIIHTISAVYLRNPEGVRLNDVVQGTFSPRLQISVFITALLVWLAMFAVNVIHPNNPSQKSNRHYEPTEALLWTLGVMCMQGSPWSPKSYSGCVLLLMSLLFAMIIYNSFAAFITSLLSVNDNPFRSIDDLLKTQILFGYVEESQDEHFLRTCEEASLRVLYYRGLVGGGGVDDVADGMTRADSSAFALFATARLARRTLHTHLSSQSRCRIMELPVATTRTAAAIPLAITSPYNTLINFWLTRIRETGILARIEKSLLPPMPSCIVGQKFHGATIQDLQSAFGALVLGMIAAVIVLLFELLFAKKRKKLVKTPNFRNDKNFVRHRTTAAVTLNRLIQNQYFN